MAWKSGPASAGRETPSVRAAMRGRYDVFMMVSSGWLDSKVREGLIGSIQPPAERDRKSTRLNSSHSQISYAVFCLKKKKTMHQSGPRHDRIPAALNTDLPCPPPQ